jgi:site-specific DNA-methyltransferase (adenine-specific)
MSVEVIHGDCLLGMGRIRPHSIDLVFADLPYGKTANTWDKQIPMDALWGCLRRVIKPTGMLVFTGIQPFTSLLVCSNLPWFKYAMVWRKNVPSGFMNAKKQPMRAHEDVLVFSPGTPKYTPQMTEGHIGFETDPNMAGLANERIGAIRG